MTASTDRDTRAVREETFDLLAGKTIKHFTPTQWTALINHATVMQQTIEFTFRTGQTIRIGL